MITTTKTVPTCLMAVMLIAVGVLTTAHAQAQALQGQLVLRSLSPQDIKDYSLTGLQGASGLSAMGVGQPAYFEAWVNIAIPAANIVGVTWSLTNKPVGSAAALTTSPLGANVPIDRPSERLVSRVAGRIVLRPDVTGQYTVVATITTTSSGTTNVSRTITAGTYMGVNTCALCHSGGVVAPDKYHPWSETLHATKFTRGINGYEGINYGATNIPFHTAGYDTNINAVNGGFDDIATQVGWTFPTNLVAGNWANMQSNYPSLANLANIQCENCHGPGSEHAMALGNTNVSNWPRIGRTFNTGNCGQCHDTGADDSVTVKVTQWKNSGHAVSPRQTGANCVRCHNAQGFKNFVNGLPAVSLPYEPIACAACHDPHDAGNPHQLRTDVTYTLPDGTSVTNAGLGGFCMNCHHSRNGSATDNIANYKLGLPTWVGGSTFGPHNNPQGDMIEGVNAITYGKFIPSGAHAVAVTNLCVACHMQPVPSTDPGFLLAGGHTFSMSYNVVTGGVTNKVDMANVCAKCHGALTSFNMVRQDFNNDGVIEGVQTEVKKLLDKLSTLLPTSIYRADGNYVADGLVKLIDRNSAKTNWPTKFLNAAYNYSFVERDQSSGVHNAPFAVGLLKASIADLTGDANNDSLPDAWQIQYFGSATAANAAPNASPAGDGIPNWLKWSLGLNPLVPGLVLPDGVVWVNTSSIGGNINTIHIYTAAEIVFDTQVGKSYQIQSVSSLSGGWQNIGGLIAGTGQSISYLTPTRSNAQQFYRVVHTP